MVVLPSPFNQTAMFFGGGRLRKRQVLWLLRGSTYETIRESGPMIPSVARFFGAYFPNSCTRGPSGFGKNGERLVKGKQLIV